MTISHGRVAEILGIRKSGLIDLYDRLGLPYLDQNIQEIEEEALQIQRSSFIKRLVIENGKSVDLLKRATGLDNGKSEAIQR